MEKCKYLILFKDDKKGKKYVKGMFFTTVFKRRKFLKSRKLNTRFGSIPNLVFFKRQLEMV